MLRLDPNAFGKDPIWRAMCEIPDSTIEECLAQPREQRREWDGEFVHPISLAVPTWDTVARDRRTQEEAKCLDN